MTARRVKQPIRYIVDASVAVKWFSREEGSVRARSILRRHTKGTVKLLAPDLLMYEVGNALARGKRLDAQSIVDALATLHETGIDFRELTSEIILRAAGFCEHDHVTFYDAAYAALAAELDAPLLSANPKDHERITGIRVKRLF